MDTDADLGLSVSGSPNHAVRQVEFTGLHAQRLKPEQNNEREVIFSEEWAREQESCLLSQLFNVPCDASDPDGFTTYGAFQQRIKRPLGDPTERDHVVAATVVQWLGSNVGMGFLYEVFRRLDYTSPVPKVKSVIPLSPNPKWKH